MSDSIDSKLDKSVNSVISQLQFEKGKFMEQQAAAKHDPDADQYRKWHPNQRLPTLIDWSKKCPNMCWNFTAIPKPMPVVPLPSQENAVVADLLLVLSGVSGRYIYPDKSRPYTFHIDEHLDLVFVQMAKALLPLASAHSKVCKFIEGKRTFPAGRVNHALSAEMSKLCCDYLAILSKLSNEHRNSGLNLLNLHTQIQPYTNIFQTLADICAKIGKDGRGGRTLSILHEAVRNSSGKTELLLQHLLETAAAPYMQQLHSWLAQGVVHDVYSEFLIEDNQVVFEKEQLPEDYSDNYWQKCYTVCKERVPDFLENSSQTILRTGKYLNVLRQCGAPRTGPAIQEVKYSCTEDKFSESIRQAHEAASLSLRQLMVDVDLLGHLRSVRNYLLLAQGDFMQKFMDMAVPELDKKIDDIVPSRLQSLLELALRTSSSNCDPYKDLLRVELHQKTALGLLLKITNGEEVTNTVETLGWEAVALVYSPPWPVSLVLNYSALTIYQLIFRHLVYCRYVERLLCRVWLEHKKIELWAAWDLRQRMLLYVSNLEYYMLVEVIEPLWNLMMKQLPNLRDLDEILECHSRFQSDCLVKCMLTNPNHFQVLNTFLRKCVEFCKFMDACGLVEASPRHNPKGSAVAFTPAESFSAKINEFNKSFTQHVRYLFRTLRESDGVRRSDKLTDMLYRFDFNSYYRLSVDRQRSQDSAASSIV